MQLPGPVVLERPPVRLEPLTVGHVDGLTAASARDEEVWRWLSVPPPADAASMRRVVEAALAAQQAGQRLPFAIVVDGVVAGSTSYLDIEPAQGRLEVGWTWLGRRWWRSPGNTTAKLLMLGHAFDTLGAERVALKTDVRNERSQAAITRLGAVREGVLRRHQRRADGSLRDTVYFSILRDEWPAVRDRLTARLAAGGGAASGSGPVPR